MTSVAAFAQSLFGATRPSGGEDEFVLALSLIVALGLLAVSAYAFRTGDLRLADRRRTLRLTAGSLIVLLVGGSFGAAAFATHIDPETDRLSFVAAVPGTDTMVVTATRSGFSGSSYYRGGADGSFLRLTGRLARAGELSPDGQWLLYESGLGALNMRDGCQLRAARLDGSEDRLIVPRGEPGSCIRSAGFSPQGSRFTMTTGPFRLQTQRFFDFEAGVETATFDIGERWEDTGSRMWTPAS